MSEQTQALLGRFYGAYNDHDAALAASLYAESGRHVEIAQGRVVEGRDAIARGLSHFLTCFPDASWRVDLVVTEPEKAAAAYVLTGTLQADLGPFVAAGQQLELRGVHLFHVAAGKLVTTEDYWDAATFGRQMRPGAPS